MSWKKTDYNYNKLHKKSDSQIEEEYHRLYSRVSKRVETFSKHDKTNLKHIRHIMTIMEDNTTRRDKEKAIMEMHRFLMLDESSYTGYQKSRRDARDYWSAFGLKFRTWKEFGTFLEFLEWVKSFQSSKYTAEAVAEAWGFSNGTVASAMETYLGMIYDE